MFNSDLLVDELGYHWLNVEETLAQIEDKIVDPRLDLMVAQRLANVAKFLRAILEAAQDD
jgi:hypothetical protein